jgi:hypothetical protein
MWSRLTRLLHGGSGTSTRATTTSFVSPVLARITTTTRTQTLSQHVWTRVNNLLNRKQFGLLEDAHRLNTFTSTKQGRAILVPLQSLGGFSLATYNITVADGAEQLTFLQQLCPVSPTIVADLKQTLERVDELEDFANNLITFVERQKDEIRRLKSGGL